MTKSIKSLILAAVVAGLAWTAPAHAQGSYAKTAQIWASQARIPDINVTSSTSATQLPLIGQIARLCNTGSNDAFVAFGSSLVTVTTANGSKLVAGTCWGYDLMPFPAPLPFPYVAAITASSTTTIYVETGVGSPPLQIGSSGGSGSNASVGATGATAPTSATLTGMTQSGNLVAMTGTAGNLNVQCANCSGSGVSTADEAAFVAGTSIFAGSGGFFQTTSTTNPLTTGQQGMFQVTANRALFSNLRNAAGAEVGTAGAPLRIDPTGGTVQPASVANGADVALGNNTDAANCASGTSLIACMRQADADIRTGASAVGASVPSGGIYAAGLASSTEPTKTTTGLLTGARMDLVGSPVTAPYANRENFLTCSITITASTSATPCTGMGAQGAGVKIYVTDINCTRSDAGTTAVTITTNIQDSTATNNIAFDLPNNGGGGGNNKSPKVPVALAANTGLTLTSSASITSEHCDAEGFKGY